MSGDWSAQLEPRLLWERFSELTRIARPSKSEGAVRDHVLAWTAERGLEAATDEEGNVVVRVPASAGRESAPTVVLQSHLDMVCERDPGSSFDPREGRIDVRVQGDWVRAEGTTLGADNGIGVAAALAVFDEGGAHGPLELLFTVSEEQGLDGAKALDPALVSGRMLVNLDGTSDDALTVGCAGSDHTLLRCDLELEAPPGGPWAAWSIELSGAKGGHSGADIAIGRVNALKALARVLARTDDLRLVSFDGGVSRNAIPRAARAVVLVPTDRADIVRSVLDAELDAIRLQYAGTDDALALSVEPVPAAPAASTGTTRRVLDLVEAIPTGVVAMSPTLPGVVETSTSLTTAVTEEGALTLGSMTRSSNAAALDDVLHTMLALARLGDAVPEVRRSYGPWEPKLDSALLAAARSTYERLFDTTPALTVVHGGLECAVLGQRLPAIEMVAIGPEIVGPHAPGEKVRVSSAGRFFELLEGLLDDLSR